MRVLLLNENPVVNKLVTLSAQKTGHELIKAESIGAVEPGTYDLLIVEEGLYDSTLVEELGSFISFSHSILVAERSTDIDDRFEKILYKPFLPTELLLMLHQTAAAVEEEISASEVIDLDVLSAELGGAMTEASAGTRHRDEAEETEEIEEMNGMDRFEPDEEYALFSEETMPEPVLKEEDVQEVRDLLDDVEAEAGLDETPAQSPDDIIERASILSAMEEEISEALMELSEEELMTSVDEELLLNIVSDEVCPEARVADEKEMPLPFAEDALLFDDKEIVKDEPSFDETEAGAKTGSIEGLEALHALLDILQNKELSKSLKGNITINLSFGEKQ